MFKMIGGVVVCGLALYGLVKFLERPTVSVVVRPDAKQPTGGATPSAAADVPQAQPSDASTAASGGG